MKELIFNIISKEGLKPLGICIGFNYEYTEGNIFIRDRENITTSLFKNIELEHIKDNYYNIYV